MLVRIEATKFSPHARYVLLLSHWASKWHNDQHLSNSLVFEHTSSKIEPCSVLKQVSPSHQEGGKGDLWRIERSLGSSVVEWLQLNAFLRNQRVKTNELRKNSSKKTSKIFALRTHVEISIKLFPGGSMDVRSMEIAVWLWNANFPRECPGKGDTREERPPRQGSASQGVRFSIRRPESHPQGREGGLTFFQVLHRLNPATFFSSRLFFFLFVFSWIFL